MAEESVTERHMSYGRGGAGNLRRPSTVVKAQEKLASLTDDPTPSTRRNSVWSMTSNGERRASLSSLKNMFRRGSTTEEPEVEKIEE